MKFNIILILLSFITSQLSAQIIPDKPNFIFIVVDDLNDYIEGYGGHPQVQTPSINEIATQGTTFLNAFTNAPGCAPSRTSFLSGKDLLYTQVLSNDDYIGDFRNNFTAAKGNEEVYTLPEVLKDSGGYFTYAINKIFHSAFLNDFDQDTDEPCEKIRSWNKLSYIEHTDEFNDLLNNYSDFGYFDYGMIPDSLEPELEDFIATDTAIQFIHDYANGIANTCDKPFFLALGYNRPHSERFIPEKYFLPYYVKNIYEHPYIIPYNQPFNAFPYNGIVLAPQPVPVYKDYYSLPENGIARAMADVGNVYTQINNIIDALPALPEIDPLLTDAEREEIIFQSINANYLSAYLAAVQFVDAQIGRVMDALQTHPELVENTIIILVSDHGYSLGEKRHWTKWSLWEPDLRIPFIIVDPSKPGGQICNSVTSLLDLYPTILDLASVEHPLFSDGSTYLDGHSIVPLLNAPAIEVDNIALTTSKKTLGIGSCFPHYSVRNERFHYIRYQSNNGGDVPGWECDITESYYEEELYDVGIDRETDPNEWNNLISSNDYTPVKEYLSQFLPGEALYLQNPLSVQISTKPLPCFLNNHTSFKLNSYLYSDLGTPIAGAGLINYEFKWSNNLTPAIYYGKTYTFNTSTIPAALFSSKDKIIFYLEVTDLITGKTAAFNIKTIHINPANTPVSDFYLTPGIPLHSVDIIDYTINGSYSDTYWTFGDGSTSEEFLPATHIYAATGNYSVKNYMEYGNGCLKSKTRNIVILREGITALDFTVYPNPAGDLINIVLERPLENTTIQIVDILGNIIITKTNIDTDIIQINSSQLIPGNYIIKISAEEVIGNKLIEIIR